ncbi:MAG TPA: hypothetical protein VH158_09660 [Gemmatimonadales bacterium]|jgi:hypothetical protein|nr:hypothetical protein [Gemmatimonadales bacterium]
MRFASRSVLSAALVGAALVAVGCQTTNTITTPGGPGGTLLPPPANLSYQLDPSGTPASPSGILLRWDDVVSASLASYRVYSRADSTSAFGLRGETTSNTFHDNGVPHLQYYVTSRDLNGAESNGSAVVTVNERLVLQAPTTISSIALDSAIHLDWSDNAYLAAPTRFQWYRVYSTGYTFATNTCDTTWSLEGTTVAHAFLVAQIPNGVARCYASSAISVEGYEGMWSPLWQDTPRPDARNVLVWAAQVTPSASGFRFWNDLNGNGYPDPGELGLVQANTTAGIDFRVDVNPSDSTLWIVPVFAGDSLQLYQSAPVADLTAMHTAPTTGYLPDSLQAQVGYGYVFSRRQGSVVNFSALRVTALTHRYVIVDWSVQTAPGNTDLSAPRMTALTGSMVPGSR